MPDENDFYRAYLQAREAAYFGLPPVLDASPNAERIRRLQSERNRSEADLLAAAARLQAVRDGTAINPFTGMTLADTANTLEARRTLDYNEEVRKAAAEATTEAAKLKNRWMAEGMPGGKGTQAQSWWPPWDRPMIAADDEDTIRQKAVEAVEKKFQQTPNIIKWDPDLRRFLPIYREPQLPVQKATRDPALDEAIRQAFIDRINRSRFYSTNTIGAPAAVQPLQPLPPSGYEPDPREREWRDAIRREIMKRRTGMDWAVPAAPPVIPTDLPQNFPPAAPIPSPVERVPILPVVPILPPATNLPPDQGPQGTNAPPGFNPKSPIIEGLKPGPSGRRRGKVDPQGKFIPD